MNAILGLIAQNWQYLTAALLVLGTSGLAVAFLFFRLKSDIRLNRKIEALAGRMSDQQTATILKRVSDTAAEDTILRLLPRLSTTKLVLRQSGLRISFVGYVAIVLLAAAAMAFSWNNPIVPSWADFFEPFIDAAIIHFLLERTVLRFLANRRKAIILDQLSAAIQHVSRSITAGQSADRAVALSAEAALQPLKTELADVVRLNAVGVPIEQSLRAASPSIDLAEYDFFIAALEASMQSGGNLARVLDELVGVIRARRQLKMKVAALTAEGKMSAIVLSLLPLGILGWLDFSNPGYVDPLYTTTAGQVMLYGGFALIGIGLAVMMRMVSFKA